MKRNEKWVWAYAKADGTPVPVAGELAAAVFTSQGDAETWLGANWPALVEQGAEYAELCRSVPERPGKGVATYSLPLRAYTERPEPT